MLERLAKRLRAAADRASPRSGSAEGAVVCGHLGGRRLGAMAPIVALVVWLAEGVEQAFQGREVAFVGCRGDLRMVGSYNDTDFQVIVLDESPRIEVPWRSAPSVTKLHGRDGYAATHPNRPRRIA